MFDESVSNLLMFDLLDVFLSRVLVSVGANISQVLVFPFQSLVMIEMQNISSILHKHERVVCLIGSFVIEHKHIK